MAAGRPTAYKKEYCERLKEHCKKGLSFKSFASEIGVCVDSLNEWSHKYPEFSAAKKEANHIREAFYEKVGLSAILGKIPNFNSTAFVWMTKNMCGWKDKSAVELTGKDGGPVQTIAIKPELLALTDEELKELLKSDKI